MNFYAILELNSLKVLLNSYPKLLFLKWSDTSDYFWNRKLWCNFWLQAKNCFCRAKNFHLMPDLESTKCEERSTLKIEKKNQKQIMPNFSEKNLVNSRYVVFIWALFVIKNIFLNSYIHWNRISCFYFLSYLYRYALSFLK